MNISNKLPRVSIGMPVFNAENDIRNALDSIVGQTFTDFELIISDNASTDKTKNICAEYLKNDSRIKYIRQNENVGGAKNFEFVLEQAVGEYFMWAAADDLRSLSFVEKNINFLDRHEEYVASTSKNYFEGDELENNKHISFSLDGGLYNRFKIFLENCRNSHGIFYSLIRTNSLRECRGIGENVIAMDWFVNVSLLTIGPIKRIDQEYIVFGRGGVSSNGNDSKELRGNIAEYIFPIYQFSIFFVKLVFKSKIFNLIEKVKLGLLLIKLNLILLYANMRESVISILYIRDFIKFYKKFRRGE